MATADLTFQALVSVRNERVAQDNKWGKQCHNWPEWMSILGEEFGEAAQAANKAWWGKMTDDVDELIRHLRTELVHTAAVAVQIIEHIDAIATPAPGGPEEADHA